MVEEILGFEGFAINAWLVWMLPFVGAAAIAGISRYGQKIRGYFAVGFSLASAIFATTLLPFGTSGGEIHSQISWISILGLEAGVLADPLSVLMTNLVAWVSFLIFVYSTGYMRMETEI
jgi:NADH-quinone oxidoreductase subunit L